MEEPQATLAAALVLRRACCRSRVREQRERESANGAAPEMLR